MANIDSYHNNVMYLARSIINEVKYHRFIEKTHINDKLNFREKNQIENNIG